MHILTSDGYKSLYSKPGVTFVEKFGRNPLVSSATLEDIWDGGGIYVFPSISSILDIKSTEVEDGAGTETGALTIGVQGLDENFDLKTEIITLNGTTEVNSVNKYIRVFRAAVRTSGSQGINEGTISIDSKEEVLTMAQIRAGIGQTNMAIYTIPKNFKGFLSKWYVALLGATSTRSTAATVDMFRRNFELANAWKSTQPTGLQNDGTGDWQYEFPHPLELPSKSDLVVNAIPTANADISAGFSITLVPE